MIKPIEYKPDAPVDLGPFNALVGELIIDHLTGAPRKVMNRVVSALKHYTGAAKLIDIDEEMGAIRLIAGEEELVVAIFELLKLQSDKYPEISDFVRKFKNHVVKLSFYPTLFQFRSAVEHMLKHGFTISGIENLPVWTAKPVVDNGKLLLAILDGEGKEIIRQNPLSIEISSENESGKAVVPRMLAEFKDDVKRTEEASLKELLLYRADFRNKILYACDAGSTEMADRLSELIPFFEEGYRDLLWVLAMLLDNDPPAKEWGIVSQFIELYREILIEVGVLRADNTVNPDEDGTPTTEAVPA
ncbi:MAG: hypothetical protein J0G33_10780 [Afipia felis]|nr:hypothetical protein [Afipia felis]